MSITYFIGFFLLVLWDVVGIISNFRRKIYPSFYFFLFYGGVLYWCYHIKISLSIAIISVLNSILIYIAFCEIDKFIKMKSSKARDERLKKQSEQIRLKLKESFEEMDLMKSDKIPTYKHIRLYYKMYLKKWELDHKDQWETDLVQPMSFENWKRIARRKPKVHKIEGSKFGFIENGGYQFIISMTMDVMMGFPPNATYTRYRDYKKIVENENNP